jgi:hypothetical protein
MRNKQRKTYKSSFWAAGATRCTVNMCTQTTRDEWMTPFNSCNPFRFRTKAQGDLSCISNGCITRVPVAHAWLISGTATRVARVRSRSPTVHPCTMKEWAMHGTCQPSPALVFYTAQKFTDLIRDDISWCVTSVATASSTSRGTWYESN